MPVCRQSLGREEKKQGTSPASARHGRAHFKLALKPHRMGEIIPFNYGFIMPTSGERRSLQHGTQIEQLKRTKSSLKVLIQREASTEIGKDMEFVPLL